MYTLNNQGPFFRCSVVPAELIEGRFYPTKIIPGSFLDPKGWAENIPNSKSTIPTDPITETENGNET